MNKSNETSKWPKLSVRQTGAKITRVFFVTVTVGVEQRVREHVGCQVEQKGQEEQMQLEGVVQRSQWAAVSLPTALLCPGADQLFTASQKVTYVWASMKSHLLGSPTFLSSCVSFWIDSFSFHSLCRKPTQSSSIPIEYFSYASLLENLSISLTSTPVLRRIPLAHAPWGGPSIF